jgi:hypothetical protein
LADLTGYPARWRVKTHAWHMSRRDPIPEELGAGPFHVRDARGHHLSASRLRASDLDSRFRGVRELRSGRDGLEERCLAFTVLLTEGQWFSHGTAATLWGMWLPTRVSRESDIHVTAELPNHAPRMEGVQGHHAKRETIEPADASGFRVTSPIDTWRQLSTILSLDELIAAGDSLVRRKNPLVTQGQLLRALARHGGHRGAKRLRLAFHEVRHGADSARETQLRLLLVRGGLPEPIVNPVISKPGAHQLMFGDLVYPELQVLVEYDGQQHRTNDVQYEKDVARLELLAHEGWLIVRVLKGHFENSPAIVARVSRALQSRGWPG